ncbi:hypothetical protein GJQ55_06770 [Venatoribacter cucullus]|uniref:Type II secretion system protein L n=1 Tax=Venatoribacter cucullus TaxID=2661630 RepID=A0A9X7YP14_9GAMM|nr:type II secretion system protein GspL [Venatoribacter cucullus]QQD24196.1 hypothetical protein GJQ55_06770 [Venatoribacter cucullus]
METVKVQWQAHTGEWLISASRDSTPQRLTQWAEALPDLTQVRLVLAAQNYACYWLSLPGVSSRHLPRALPFALEESLIGDIADYLIVPAGSAQKQVRAYVVANDLIERLLEACEMHHVRVLELIPETSLLGDEPLLQRTEGGWLASLPGRFEGYVGDAALTPVLESLFADEAQLASLTLRAPQLATAQLLQTTLESSFAGQIGSIHSEPDSGAAATLPARPVNLLTGQYQVRPQRERRHAPWWQALAGMAAAWVLFWTLTLYLDVQRLQQQSGEVRQQTISLYQQLFPGERVRALERQIREKLSGDSGGSDAGFLSATHTLAQVYQQQGLQQQVQLTSLRFNDRLQELMVEVQAKGLNDLQVLRQALEQAGLSAEIASATNDNNGVKGRIRIGGRV